MGVPLGYDRGGIVGLLTLPREQWEAIEADLMTRGWTLQDVPHRVGWRSILAMVRHSSRESALVKVTDPVGSAWNVETYLQAMQVDMLRLLVWFKTKDAQQNRRRPEPIPRPGDAPKSQRFGDAEMTTDEVDAFLARRRAAATCAVNDCQNKAGPDGPCADHSEDTP